MLSSSDNPWRPLTALYGDREEDRTILEETRGEELHVVNNMVASSRVSLLYAMSGSGKTSLLQAGVIPFFQRRGHVVFTTRPRPPWARDDPRRAFRSCIARQVPAMIKDTADQAALTEVEQLLIAQQRTDLTSVIGRLRPLVDVVPASDMAEKIEKRVYAGGESLRAFMNGVADLVGRDRHILLVCDQFEELFVHYANEPQFHTFISDLAALWADESMNVRLLFSMREDWVGSMIALRRVIPDVFKDSFRLLPLTAEDARLVLTRPLQSRGIPYDEAMISAIVDDLVASYEATDTRRLGNIEPQQPRGTSHFVELSALQLVAGCLWETRDVQRKPFSLEHYLSLAPEDAARERTPVMHVIEDYLSNELVAPKDPASEAMRELQVDSVYALTDRDRHRRACSAAQIARDVKRSRPAELYPNAPLPEAVTAALKPLVRSGLLRTVETSNEDPDFELAHDFAVRAAVRTWRALDYRRAKDLGRAARERERKDERLQHLEARNETTTLILQLAPLIGLVGLIWAGLKLIGGDPSALGVNPAEARPGLLVFAAFTALLAAGAIARHRLSLIVAALAIVSGVIAMIWLGDAKRATTNMYVAMSEESSRLAQGLDQPKDAAFKEKLRIIFEAAKAAASSDSPATSAVRDAVSNLQVYPGEESYARGQLGDYLDGLAKLEIKIRQAGVFLLLVTCVLFILCVRSEASLLAEENPWRDTLFVAWGELIDMITYAPSLAILIIGYLNNVMDAWVVAAGVAAITFGVRQFIIRKLHSTPGLRAAGFFIERNGNQSAMLVRILVRELTLVVWSALNVVLIPWLLGTLYIRATSRTILDKLARTRLTDSSEQAPYVLDRADAVTA